MKTLLARLCANRFITCSPDSVLHLTWRHFTLHMMNMDLIQVVKFLESIKERGAPGFTHGDSCCTVNWRPNNQVELWLWGVGFVLEAEELGELLLLGKTAVRHFKTVENDPIRLLMDAELPTYPEMVLSLN